MTQPPRTPRLFAKPLLGWSCIAICGVLLAILVFALYHIVPLLTQPPGFLERSLEKAPPLDVSFAVALEYESYAIRAQGIQIALGFIIGLFMAVFGIVLFTIVTVHGFLTDLPSFWRLA